MMNANVLAIPISQIVIANPRPRNRYTFDQIVTSIRTVGLKTPITVSKRQARSDGTQYDLVCGQGRLEAFLALGQITIPAIIIEASREDQYLTSLIENIARRPPSQLGLLTETKSLRERGYSADEIALKLGFSGRYIATIVALLGKGEIELLRLVEAGKIPLTVAVEISDGTSADMQRALTEAYEAGELRGSKLRVARNLIRKRQVGESPRSNGTSSTTRLTAHAVAKKYQDHTRVQRSLVKRANVVRKRLIIIAAGCRQLSSDGELLALLRDEQLELVFDKLLELIKEL